MDSSHPREHINVMSFPFFPASQTLGICGHSLNYGLDPVLLERMIEGASPEVHQKRGGNEYRKRGKVKDSTKIGKGEIVVAILFVVARM